MAAKAKSKKAETKAEPIVSYKGFDKDFRCRGFQFEVGKTYKVEGNIVACENGFHACENPFDVWSYYPVVSDDGSFSRYAVVEQGGKTDRHSGDSKIASAEITIKAEIALPDFIRKCVSWVLDNTKGDNTKGASDECIQAASGVRSRLAASGYSSRLAASGDRSQLAASGDSSQLAASGKDSVIASSARNAIASGADGTWISLAEFNDDGKCVGFVTGCVGKDGLKPNTWYRAKDGKFVEVGQ